jgi:hypothetical protein
LPAFNRVICNKRSKVEPDLLLLYFLVLRTDIQQQRLGLLCLGLLAASDHQPIHFVNAFLKEFV